MNFQLKTVVLKGANCWEKQKTVSKERGQHLGPELFFREHMLRSPLRTKDPEAASLFVLPAVFGLVLNGLCDCSAVSIMQNISHLLESSPYYRRGRGTDHLVVASDNMVRFALF
mmetsp:Transcript_14703/g.34978  ORF Transcript_14703/g.34978 Transcript_14703/m.34978 type:complete len:114 (+) Transcript_14703:352-693(+)